MDSPRAHAARTTYWVLAVTLTASACAGAEEASRTTRTARQSLVLTFRDAVSQRDWKRAETCLASGLRDMLKDAIDDRAFFDQYVVTGFGAKTLELLPANRATEQGIAEIARLDGVPSLPGAGPERCSAIVASGGGECPWIAQCWFVKEKDGWKLTLDPQFVKKKEDFDKWYETAIPRESRGRARELEGKPVERAAPGGP